MARGKKVQIVFSEVLHNRLSAYAERSGLTINQSITAILNGALQLQHVIGGMNKPSDLNRVLKELLKKSTPYAEKVGNGTITFSERDEWYEILEQVAKTKIALGTELRDLDDVMQAHYRREYDELQGEFDYETIRYEAGMMTDEGEKTYKEIEQRINDLKDRLK